MPNKTEKYLIYQGKHPVGRISTRELQIIEIGDSKVKRLIRRREVSEEAMIEARTLLAELNQNTITVTIVDKSTTASSIPVIPRDENDPKYLEAARLFFEFYDNVLKFLKSMDNVKVEEKGSSEFDASVSRYIRFTITNPITGNLVNYLFELRISNHLLPENWEAHSFQKLQNSIDNYYRKNKEQLEPYSFDFVVNNTTYNSYEVALEDVKQQLQNLISKYIKDEQ